MTSEDVPQEGPVRVLLVDDEQLVRAGFRMLFEVEPDIEVVGEAEDGESAVAMARELTPDVILMDVQMPGLGGIAATGRIVEEGEARVIVLTTFDDEESVLASLQAGASGFLLKTSDPAHLVHAIRTAARGNSVLAPEVTRQVIERGVSNAGATEPTVDQQDLLSTLTERETEVLGLVARGLSNGEIADHLSVGAATVKTHVSACLAKLQVRDRVQLVVFAFESGAADADPGEQD